MALLLGAELRMKSYSSLVLAATQQHCMLLHNLYPQVKGITTDVVEPPFVGVGVGVGVPISHHRRLLCLRRLQAWSCVRSATVLDT